MLFTFTPKPLLRIIPPTPIRPPTRRLNNFIILPTPRPNPNWRIESRLPLIPIMIRRIIMILKLPLRRSQPIATIHIWQHGLLSVVQRSEAGALDLVMGKEHLVPALAAAVWVLGRRPRTIGAPRVELVLVVSVIADVAAPAFPVHRVVRRVARIDKLLHALLTLILIECRDAVAERDDVVVLLGRAFVVGLAVAPVDCIGGVLVSDLLAKLFVVLVGAVPADVVLAAGAGETCKLVFDGAGW